MMSEIRGKIDVLFEQLAAEGYVGHEGHVARLIAQCRATLMRGTGQLGPWEVKQLDAAERAMRANYLRLGLIAAQNALAVSQLPAEEYEYGVNCVALCAMPGTAGQSPDEPAVTPHVATKRR